MAHQTAEQSDAVRELTLSYGKPDRVAIEHTDEPYGVVLVLWEPRPEFRVDERRILIRPDGTRLSWRTLEFAGEAV